MAILHTSQHHQPWNKGKLIGQKAPLKLKDIWAIRISLQFGQKVRDLALFNALYPFAPRPLRGAKEAIPTR